MLKTSNISFPSSHTQERRLIVTFEDYCYLNSHIVQYFIPELIDDMQDGSSPWDDNITSMRHKMATFSHYLESWHFHFCFLAPAAIVNEFCSWKRVLTSPASGWATASCCSLPSKAHHHVIHTIPFIPNQTHLDLLRSASHDMLLSSGSHAFGHRWWRSPIRRTVPVCSTV